MKISRIPAISAGALLAISLSTSSASAATAVFGSVFQRTSAQVGGLDAIVDVEQTSWSPTSVDQGPHDLRVFSEAQQFFTDTAINLGLSETTIAAHWDSANTGSVIVTDRGLSTGTPTAVVDLLGNTQDTGMPDWSYDFTAGANETFNLTFSVTGLGEVFGMGTWRLLFSEDDGLPELTTLSSDFGLGNDGADEVIRTGQFSHALQDGHFYSISLASVEGVHQESGSPSATGSEHDEFSWSIDGAAGAVPEPTTWALTIMGFGLVGAALRRRTVAQIIA